MAHRTVVELLDDIDGKPAEETVTFSLDGVTYEIDLSADNADKLRKNLTPYVEKARKATARQAGRLGKAPSRTAQTRERSADIRNWAKQHGITVNDRGRISAQVVEAYEAGDPSLGKDTTKVSQPMFQDAAH
ncbi:histone-like nucleoid-structuring protein Lsr2 [Actinomadura sp. HBU206391]|uniref:histone-like nucleoid-structuring protein Lsr2 n=1 Tax=Actinomadura sp. HBU206391 TaxID=2731692 RepID=UPI0016507A23|nr:Lsr2 family protein [Actinomadura sp. HBU206391]MBC6462868.1 Lsr2 family protein [Actinomadura sp. HBU206391]